MDIDHVYTWVNPEDNSLNELRASYSAQEVKHDHAYRAGTARTADHGELRASIGTAQRLLPFVRNTIIFGAGAPPVWLSDYGSKVTYVRQEDVIPSSIWPTFNSYVVECFIHEIPGLAEHYIYSNDDFFFAKRHTPADFFSESGLPRVGLATYAAAVGEDCTYRTVESNGIRALRRHLTLPEYVSSLPKLSEQLRPKARYKLFRQNVELRRRGLRLVNPISHVSQPYLNSHWAKYHQVFASEIKALFDRRFRSEQDIGVNFTYLYFLQSIGKAEFYLATEDKLLNRDFSIAERFRLRDALLAPNSSISRFCINDTPVTYDDGWDEFVTSLAHDLERRDAALSS